MTRLLITLLLLCTMGAKAQTSQTLADFNARKAVLTHGHLFDIFHRPMTDGERDAMHFLYAYMPVNDIADYDGDFFLNQVRATLNVRTQVGWQVPDEVFRHFVLPIRVNNENLDTARLVFQRELLPRVRGRRLYDAVLEVNHWCHEKANYQPSDARTSSPLATVRTAWGRCGEESTLLVAALRSVGIPARQVYTPRWAHTDDNHAWVEAWVDGRWYFLGACEPEPVLNLGWFNAPASRGMLMHTKVFGRYNGPEEVMRRTANYTEINVISNYAPAAPLTVRVTDAKGRTVQGARVEYRIYNYGEFFPVSIQTTDAKGQVSLSAGYGDMLVIATHGSAYGYSRVSFGREPMVTVALSHKIGERHSADIDITPPKENAQIPTVTPAQRADNDRRFAIEDSIRAAYRATFMQGVGDQATRWGDRARSFMVKAEGNWRTIHSFLAAADESGQMARALDLLSTLTDKDLRDVCPEVLTDALSLTPADASVAHVLAPRVSQEWLTPYRSVLACALRPVLGSRWGDVDATIAFCRDSITRCDTLATSGTFTTPVGVLRSRLADLRSLKVFFTALCRTQGIEAWVDGVTGNVYYRRGDATMSVNFDSAAPAVTATTPLTLSFTPQRHLDDPEYYTHFTLSRYQSDGTFGLLNYDEGARWSKLFAQGCQVEPGYYLLTTGTRLANGSVKAHIDFFPVAHKPVSQALTVREATNEVSVIGSVNSEGRFRLAATGAETSILLTAGRGYFVVGVLGVGQEPTNHALRDIAQRRSEFEAWGRTIVLLFASDAEYQKYLKSPIPGLPSTVVMGVDTDGQIAADLRQRMRLADTASLPLFVIGDTFNRVVFESHGYTIGMGDQLLKTIRGL